MPKKLHNALTDTKVRHAKEGRHADGGGLYLRVQGGGARSWLFRAVVGGKARDVGLGPAAGPNALSLADARKAARAMAVQLAAGEQVEGKRSRARRIAQETQAQANAARTFRQVAEAMIADKEAGWRNDKHRQQWRNTLADYVYPHFGDLPVAQVATAHVLDALRPIWTAKPETASRVRGRIERVLSAAKAQGLRSGENPALWRGHLDHLLAKQDKLKRGHHAALAYAELPAFMSALRTREGVAGMALEFAILTAARSGEVIGATWGEIDGSARTWTIPANRMKGGREHVVPLSPQAWAVLEKARGLRKLETPGEPLFPGYDNKALSSMALAMLVRRMHDALVAAGEPGWIDRKADGRIITVHGFRSTFRDWAGEQTSFAREVIEHALAHGLPSKTEAAYARATLLPKRSKLMAAWATYCASSASAAAVVPIRGKSKISEGSAR